MSSFEDDLLEDRIKTNMFDPVLLRRLVGYLKPHPARVATAFTLTLMSALFALAVPLLLAVAVDVLFPSPTVDSRSATSVLAMVGLGSLVDALADAVAIGRETALGLLGISFAFAVVMRFLIDWGNGYLLAKLSQSVLLDIRMQVFAHIQSRNLSWLHRNPVGRLITRVTNDVGALDEFFSQALLAVLRDVTMLAGTAALMLIAHFKLGLITMTVMPAMVVISIIFRYFVRRAYRRWRAALSRLNAVMAETVNGVRVVQLFRRQATNQRKYEAIGEDYKQAFIQMRKAWALYRPGYTIIQAAAMGLVIWFGGGWVLGETLDMSILTLFILLAEMFFQPVRDLVEKFDIVQSAVTSGERIFTVLDEKDEIPQKPDAIARDSIQGRIAFRDVHFSYIEGEPVLKGVSFEVEPGQTVAIVGHTGAGKSTIINLISRFYDLQGGQILVDGVDVRDWQIRSLREKIAVVHQDVFLFAGTVMENLTLNSPRVSEESAVASAQAVGVEPFIMRLDGGYRHVVQEQGKTFSAGERQLLSFARALAHNPSILVLDEATSSIDTRAEMQIQQAMKELLKGRTSIVIAHRLSTIQSADRILVMHHGELAESGNHQELLARRGLYHKLYQLQFAEARALAG